MGQFRASSTDFFAALGKHGAKIYAALRQGIEDHDYDSGWVATPANKVFYHGLNFLPRFIQAQTSAYPDGTDYLTEHPVGVNTSQITVSGTKAYYRVMANR